MEGIRWNQVESFGQEDYGMHPEQKCPGFFMHAGTQRKMSAEADGRPAREQGGNFPCSITQGCVRKFREGSMKNFPWEIRKQ